MAKPNKNKYRSTIFMALAVIGASLAQISAPAVAASQHYTIQFSGQSVTGELPTGSFDYDAAIPGFSNFLVKWTGLNFDLTAAANTPVIAPGPNTVCGVSGAAVSFLLLSNDGCLAAEFLSPKKWEVENFFGNTVNLGFVGGGGQRNMFFNASASESFADVDKCDPSGNCAGGTWLISRSVPVSVPEPATLGLIATGFIGLAAFRRRGR